MKKEDLILSKFKASEFIKSKEEAIRFFDAVLEIALGDSKKFFMKSFEDVINSFSGWEEYQALLSDQLAKQEGVEIIEELKVENKKLKEQLSTALETLGQIAKLSNNEVDATHCAKAISDIVEIDRSLVMYILKNT